MPRVTRSRLLPYTPQHLYTVLTQIENLPHVAKRIERITVIEQISATEAHAQAWLDLPMGQSAECTGYVRGIPDQQLSFRTEAPFPLEFTWELRPEAAGTEIISTLDIDLGMMAALIPNTMVEGVLAAELEADLERLAGWLAQ